MSMHHAGDELDPWPFGDEEHADVESLDRRDDRVAELEDVESTEPVQNDDEDRYPYDTGEHHIPDARDE